MFNKKLERRIRILEKTIKDRPRKDYKDLFTANPRSNQRYRQAMIRSTGVLVRLEELESRYDKLEAIISELVDDYYGGK